MLHHCLRSAAKKAPPIEFVGYCSAVSTGANTLTLAINSLTGGVDTAARADDLVLVIGSSRTYGTVAYNSSMVTSGYTGMLDTSADYTYEQTGVYWKRMGATPDASAVFGARDDTYATAVATVWRGVNAVTPMDVALSSATGRTTTTPDPPSITPVTSGAVIVALCASGSHNYHNGAFSAPSGMTLRGAAYSSTASLGLSKTGVASVLWTGGAYDPAAFTGSNTTSVTTDWVAATIALRPA